MKKRLFSAIVSLCILLTMAPTVAFAADTSVSGGISWNITDGTLTISAADIPEDGYTKGVMPNYAYGKQPWNSNKSNIQSIVIKAKVTNIRERAFQDTKVTVQSSAPIRKSPAKADFRIVTMHHPFDDDLTRKYIPSIVESGNVNIMFSGHTHLYARYASANPARGTDTLYVTQVDARIGDGETDNSFYQRMMDGLWQAINAQELFRLLHDDMCGEIDRLRNERMLREARPITDAKRFIQQHYQEALRLEDVSNAVGFNATYFSAMFKKETGQNFMDYLTELRMNKAKEPLCSDENSVQDVADQIGYRDLKYFSRLFKKTTGISPSEYKKLYR